MWEVDGHNISFRPSNTTTYFNREEPEIITMKKWIKKIKHIENQENWIAREI